MESDKPIEPAATYSATGVQIHCPSKLKHLQEFSSYNATNTEGTRWAVVNEVSKNTGTIYTSLINRNNRGEYGEVKGIPPYYAVCFWFCFSLSPTDASVYFLRFPLEIVLSLKILRWRISIVIK